MTVQKLRNPRSKPHLVAYTGIKGVGPTSPVHTVSNIPRPSRLGEEARIQEEVQNRLRHLADNVKPGMGKIKSQRGGAVDVLVNHKVRWPHEFVLSGQNKDRVTYNQLSPVQWLAGFCRSIREESDTKIREYMLDYIIDLLDDATDFSWASAKASHAVLLCRMEQGEIGSGWKPNKLTGYVGLTLKDTIMVKVVLKEHKTSIHPRKLPLVYIKLKGCARKNKPMRLKVSCTNTYVPCAGPKTVKLTPTHRLNVAGVQKTSKPGHAPGFEMCPAF